MDPFIDHTSTLVAYQLGRKKPYRTLNPSAVLEIDVDEDDTETETETETRIEIGIPRSESRSGLQEGHELVFFHLLLLSAFRLSPIS